MDEYLDEEIESLRNALELICRGWDKKAREVSTTPDPDLTSCSFQNTPTAPRITPASSPRIIRLK